MCRLRMMKKSLKLTIEQSKQPEKAKMIGSIYLDGAYHFQSVKERQFSLCESWRFSRIKEEIGQKNKEIRAAPLPEGQFFEIHSSIFKPHPC